MKYPTPRPIHRNPQYGDIGVNKLTLAVSDVGSCQDLQGKGQLPRKTEEGETSRLGDYEFVYARDPDGNILDFATWDGARWKTAPLAAPGSSA